MWIEHPWNTSELARTLFPVERSYLLTPNIIKITHTVKGDGKEYHLWMLAESVSQYSMKF